MNKDDENFNTNNKNNTCNGNISSTSSSWLGFSLSPTLDMDQQQQQLQEVETEHVTACSDVVVPTAIPTCIFRSQSNIIDSNNNNINYGMFYGSNVEGENGGGDGGLSSSSHVLPVMPLKSDGSLCLMEAVTKHQQQTLHATMVTTTSITPKLENFFGGASATMALSLDSIYYNQTNFPQQQDIRVENYPFHTNYFRGRESFSLGAGDHGTSAETQVSSFNLQLPVIGEDEANDMKNWVSRNCISGHAMDTNTGNESAPSNASTGSLSAITYGDLQCLSLSISPGSQSSCVTGNQQISHVFNECEAMETRKRRPDSLEQKQIVVHRKSIDTFGQRTSQYRGVTRHRWTGRYEAHLWDNSCKKEGQSRKGRQVYLGGYDMEEKAARAYDLAALKYWGPSTHINFHLENYQNELKEMKNMTRQEYVAHLRRKSSGFSRGASAYRGVTRHHQHGRWQARIGRVAGNKDLYLGTFSTQEEAAEAYDVAAIKFRGANAVTNFDINRYDVERIMASNTLLAGDQARRNKATAGTSNEAPEQTNTLPMQNANAGPNICNQAEPDWKRVFYQSSQQLNHNQKPGLNGTDGYRTLAFSLVPENAIFSNASSLVTSLSSSREASPDEAPLQQTIFAAMPQSTQECQETKMFTNSTTSNVNSWIQRPSVTLPHMPVFAAWTDLG